MAKLSGWHRREGRAQRAGNGTPPLPLPSLQKAPRAGDGRLAASRCCTTQCRSGKEVTSQSEPDSLFVSLNALSLGISNETGQAGPSHSQFYPLTLSLTQGRALDVGAVNCSSHIAYAFS